MCLFAANIRITTPYICIVQFEVLAVITVVYLYAYLIWRQGAAPPNYKAWITRLFIIVSTSPAVIYKYNVYLHLFYIKYRNNSDYLIKL